MYKKVEDNPLLKKAFDFSLMTIEIYKELLDKHEFVMSKQLLRCATSIGANLNEGVVAQSRKDFISKFNISLKEAYETRYWLNLLLYSKYLDSISKEISLLEEIIRMAVKSILNAKQKMESK
ncbi:MAG: four helix bundle protein [Candidatus Izemoplasmatales bacterium]|nr:four helix bundle protein [Candidatus Izemoplasmatales bacterium]